MKIINLKFGDILFNIFFTTTSLIDNTNISSLLRSDVTKSADLIFLEIGIKKIPFVKIFHVLNFAGLFRPSIGLLGL